MRNRQLNLLEKTRIEKGLTQARVAELIGLTQSTYLRIEKEVHKPRDSKTLSKICAVLELDEQKMFEKFKMEKPKLAYVHGNGEMPLFNDIKDEKVIVNEFEQLEYLNVLRIFDIKNIYAISFPNDNFTPRFKKAERVIAAPNQKIDIGDYVLLWEDKIIEEYIGIEVKNTLERWTTPAVLRSQTKDEIVVDLSLKNNPKKLTIKRDQLSRIDKIISCLY